LGESAAAFLFAGKMEPLMILPRMREEKTHSVYLPRKFDFDLELPIALVYRNYLYVNQRQNTTVREGNLLPQLLDFIRSKYL